MRYLIYCRVSPKGSDWVGAETTVVDQAAQCRAYILATDADAVITETITDEFESGVDATRPGWMRILAQLKSGAAPWDVLVVRHLDRFSRSIADAVAALELLHKAGKHLIATAQGLNSSTPSGRGVINILLSIAQMEREFASERTRLKMVSIAAKGGWPSGTAPYGYKRAGNHDNTLRVDKPKARVVLHIFERYCAGVGCTEISRETGLHKNTVLLILRNKAYLGIVSYAGVEYKGLHEPIITPQLWAKVQQALPGPYHSERPRSQQYPYLLTGLIRCACGKYMTPASAHGRTRKYNYYSCTDSVNCRARVPAPELEESVIAALRKVELSDKSIKMIERAIRRKAAPATAAIPELEEALKAARERRDNLTAMFARGVVTKENAPEINRLLARAISEANELEGRLGAQRRAIEASPLVVEEVVRWARSIRTLGAALDVRGKREDLRLTLSTWIKEIRRTEDKWVIELTLPGSPNCTVWLRELDLDEPLHVCERGNVIVRARIVA